MFEVAAVFILVFLCDVCPCFVKFVHSPDIDGDLMILYMWVFCLQPCLLFFRYITTKLFG